MSQGLERELLAFCWEVHDFEILGILVSGSGTELEANTSSVECKYKGKSPRTLLSTTVAGGMMEASALNLITIIRYQFSSRCMESDVFNARGHVSWMPDYPVGVTLWCSLSLI